MLALTLVVGARFADRVTSFVGGPSAARPPSTPQSTSDFSYVAARRAPNGRPDVQTRAADRSTPAAAVSPNAADRLKHLRLQPHEALHSWTAAAMVRRGLLRLGR